MRKWLGGGAILAAAAVGTYFILPKPTPPAPPAPVVAAAPAPGPAQPVVLAEVVDVTDIESLLDPPKIPLADPADRGPVVTAVGLETPAAPSAVVPAAAVVPIPAAID